MSECPLCVAVHSEVPLKTIPSNGGIVYVILKTKDMKGHPHRVMVVSDRHGLYVPESSRAIAALFQFIIEGHQCHDWVILSPTHATVKDHWHRVASDTDPKGKDSLLIERTDRIEIRFKAAGECSR